ncbi:hypothetical protein [Anaerotignum propionicum]|uniref:hypothetical protein n=1 Tax=Anaerotignum propionicum TaxID=28446 RepID=UPI00210AF282|nr:hypothetical protein [Anaerotignum propionicum]MCQ4935015.1 hypothetical protein [Anaerotignum propionicum]
MEKELLSQYADLQAEIEDLQRRILKTESQIERIQAGGTVLDSVRGTRKDGTIGNIRIEGFPVICLDEKLDRLYRYRSQLRNSEKRVVELVSEVEKYINSIEDCRMRRIIRYRFIDKLSWNAVADKMGGNATGESVRKNFERF